MTSKEVDIVNKSMVGLLVVSIACLVTVGSIVLSKRVGEDLKATDLPTATISIPNTETPESQLTSTPEPTIGYRSIKIIPTGVPTDGVNPTGWTV